MRRLARYRLRAPIFEEDGIKLFTDERNAANLRKLAGNDRSLTGILRAHLNQLGAGDYMALLGIHPDERRA